MAKNKERRRGVSGISFGKPIERPPANRWSPQKNETRVFMLRKILDGKFGTSYLVEDLEDHESYFLPSHSVLQSILGSVKLKEGNVMQIKCTNKGSKKVGDFYDYVVRLAKSNAPF